MKKAMEEEKTVRKGKTGRTWGLLPIFYLLSLISYLIVASCSNATLDDTSSGGNNYTGGEEEQYDDTEDEEYEGEEESGPAAPKKLITAVTQLSLGDAETTGPGASVATLNLPEGWTASLPNYEDNALFKIAGAEVVVTDGIGTLPLGSYVVAVYITPDEGAAFFRTFRFSVSKTPAAFKNAPKVYPSITAPGKNKLSVSWNERPAGTTGFQLYVGLSKDPAAAHPYGEKYTAPGNTHALEITDVDWDNTDGGLPDGTTYYVWVRAFNAEGEGGFGPPGTHKTSDTMPSMLWVDEQGEWFTTWDSFYGAGGGSIGGSDFYIVRPPTADHPGGTLRYGPGPNGSLPTYKSDIVHFINAGWKGSRGKWGENASGYGGVFIIRYHDDTYSKQPFPPGNGYAPGGEHRPYFAVYYASLGAIQTVGPPVNTYGPNNDARGLLMCYFGNSYDYKGVLATGFLQNPETATHEQALDRFTIANTGVFIAGVAIPWYRKYGEYDLTWVNGDGQTVKWDPVGDWDPIPDEYK